MLDIQQYADYLINTFHNDSINVINELIKSTQLKNNLIYYCKLKNIVNQKLINNCKSEKLNPWGTTNRKVIPHNVYYLTKHMTNLIIPDNNLITFNYPIIIHNNSIYNAKSFKFYNIPQIQTFFKNNNPFGILEYSDDKLKQMNDTEHIQPFSIKYNYINNIEKADFFIMRLFLKDN